MNNQQRISKQNTGNPAKQKRRKKRNLTSKVYGARLPVELAFEIEEYAKSNQLECSEVVRLGLYQFALKEKMLYRKRNSTDESQGPNFAQQLSLITARLDETFLLINSLSEAITEIKKHTQPLPPSEVQKLPPNLYEGYDPQTKIARHFLDNQRLFEQLLIEAIRMVLEKTNKRFLTLLGSSQTTK